VEAAEREGVLISKSMLVEPSSGNLGVALSMLTASKGYPVPVRLRRPVRVDQYINPGNWQAHYHTTAPAIARQFPRLDVLFVGAGAAGTLMCCARYFREWHRGCSSSPWTASARRVSGGPGPTDDAGLGTSVPPPLFGGSTGTV
jgi:N-(2-amino-2-carboxyethyl)-L-glutamate synthase